MARRQDIQGLRALAVLFVVAYHTGLPLPGGFAGVDVFFVVSGFVITSMLRREQEATGRIAFGAFYLRRFKRLVPALSVLVAFTAAASSLALSPFGPQEKVARTGIGALFFFANWTIASTTGGYFDAPAGTNPLLHTWSLSVEEQFYLVFPAVLALCALSRRRSVPIVVVGALTALSFAAMLAGGDSWLVGFYGPVSRAWEFGAGALLALATARGGLRSRAAATIVWAAGAEALLVAVSALGDDAGWPGLATVLPVGATALLILGGTNERAPLTRVLSVRPLAAIGDRSYSIHLWHWPLIVLATALWPATPHVRLYAALASFVPAALSYRLVEQPFRSLRIAPARRLALLAAAVLAFPFAVDGALAATVHGVWSPGYGARDAHATYPGNLGELPFYQAIAARYPACADARLLAHELSYQDIPRCAQSSTARPVTVAVIGDSHAEHLFPGLAGALPRQNVLYAMVDDFPSLRDPDFARIVRTVAAQRSIDTVVLTAYWTVRELRRPEQLVPTLRALRAPGRRIFLTDDVANFGFDAAACKYRKSVIQAGTCTESARRFWSEYAVYEPVLRAAAAAVPGVRIIRTARVLCTAATCTMVHAGRLLYRDFHHLNVDGSRFVAARMLRDPAFAASMG
jgi:peptidoglycan/LPS O-acetylase OafA/YrhL